MDWAELWSKKIDYIEYQLTHIENKYPIVAKSIHYYIGMTEAAISYLNFFYSKEALNNMKEQKYISHIRIDENNFSNPLNITVDYFARDVSEYLKYIFIINSYDYDEINAFLKSCNLSDFEAALTYARLIYPSYYFDMYDNIVNNLIDEKKIVTTIARVNEYECYIKKIHTLLSEQNHNILDIKWI